MTKPHGSNPRAQRARRVANARYDREQKLAEKHARPSVAVGPRVTVEDGAVIVEWRRADVAPEFLERSATGALIGAAEQVAVRAGHPIRGGSAIVRLPEMPPRVRVSFLPRLGGVDSAPSKGD